MGRNLQNVTLALASIALLLSIIGIVTGHIQNSNNKDLTVCTVDLWGVSSNISHLLSQKDADPQAAQTEINRAMAQVENSLSTPKNYGCDIIAVKGSVFGAQVRDITSLILNDVRRQDSRK